MSQIEYNERNIMLVDEAEISVKGGQGGAGAVAFFAKRGGPSGGDGGKGGNVIAQVNNNYSDLKKYLEKAEYQAENGFPGDSNRKIGAKGKDLNLYFPSGTTFVNLDTHEEFELNNINQKILLCYGGMPGRGNEAFKTSTHQTPRKAESGLLGQEKRFKLILKLIADFGLIGLPNAGKSSILNELTAANVKTANYPFTTLEANLGSFNGKIIADIPGLIEGASKGKGLGVNFLKHIEKVKLILHCVSVESETPDKDYKIITNELKSYSEILLKKESIILLTKIDLIDQKSLNKKINQLKQFKKTIIPISIYQEKSFETLKKMLLMN